MSDQTIDLPEHVADAAQALVVAVREAGALAPSLSIEQVIHEVRHALAAQEASGRSGIDRSHELSKREREVLGLLRTGATNREIAVTMHVGVDTVKKHAGSLYRKLGVRNRTEAAQRASTLGAG